MDELIRQVKALPPEQKIRLFLALGMDRVGDSHDQSCPSLNTSSPCNCVPPDSTWTHPKDVEIFLKEVWEDLLERAHERQRRINGKGKS